MLEVSHLGFLIDTNKFVVGDHLLITGFVYFFLLMNMQSCYGNIIVPFFSGGGGRGVFLLIFRVGRGFYDGLGYGLWVIIVTVIIFHVHIS